MLLEEIRVRKAKFSGCLLATSVPTEEGKEAEFCQDGFKKIVNTFFHVPDVFYESCWVRFYNRAGVDRVRCSVEGFMDGDDTIPTLILAEDAADKLNNRYEVNQSSLDSFIESLIGRVVYIEVWYK